MRVDISALNLVSHGVFATDDSAEMQRIHDMELSQQMWENGSMDTIMAINSGDVEGDYIFDGQGNIGIMITPPVAGVSGSLPEKNVYDFLHDIYGDITGGDYDNDVASETLRQVADLYGMTTDEFKEAYANGEVGNEFEDTAGELRENITLDMSQDMNLLENNNYNLFGLQNPYITPDGVSKPLAEGWYGSNENDSSNYIALENGARLPINENTDYEISSEFGWRQDPHNADQQDYHTGIDIGVPEDTPVNAVKDGVVIRQENHPNGYGNVVYIEHSNGDISLYAHNNENLVNLGQHVNEGDHIANSGNTGSSTGPHIHFEIRENGQYINQENGFIIGPTDPLLYNWR